MADKTLAPFSCSFTPNLPELLTKLDCTLVITTFQAGKVIFISPQDEERLIQLPRSFQRPMGLALKDDKMAVATSQEVIILRNSQALAKTYPKKPDIYDACFVPRAAYFTGQADIHDLHWGTSGLYAVNTAYSCLCRIDEAYSFTPTWKPHFISALTSEDRCHMNGLAMYHNEPAYISALGTGNSPQSWRENITSGGCIIDIESNEIVIEGLAMPHSPRMYDDKLYVLLSAKEQLVCVDVQSGTYEVVAYIGGFVRGMCRLGDFLFVSTSKLRKNSSTFRHLEIADKADVASVSLLHLPTATVMSKLTYHTSVDEIYDVQVLPGIRRPNILNTITDDFRTGIQIPQGGAWVTQKKPARQQ